MVSTVTSTSDTTAAAAAMKKATGLNKDDFLRLFVTQLQNQDPLNPQDSSQFITQLAQITEVEQSYNTNTNLQSILTQSNNMASLSAVSFIGKSILAPGSQISHQSGSASTIDYNLSSTAQTVTITITDESGATVKTLTQGLTAAGYASLAWDGTNNQGQSVTTGIYNVTVKGTDADGAAFSGTPLIRGKVDGVEMGSSGPVLTVGALQVPLSGVISVKGGA
ncbi:flagellar hook capping protein FlgD [Geotalea daltonii FRC-32]|uniref:Basal-body rod modification protein FlgD n=1 Tax=Geotalea daltonii (strain DSM 22248 / JCM 15807 / FRC-32) TaxID=316067 RepID=B9LZQ6_GEODF|nr:flagellar hook capping FlgD N-terminal domain-containing protein [Geotalea daltonii]ACM18870.1 flagellar hook capping protein FlgD [Geotalea daltonii FRC-32]